MVTSTNVDNPRRTTCSLRGRTFSCPCCYSKIADTRKEAKRVFNRARRREQRALLKSLGLHSSPLNV